MTTAVTTTGYVEDPKALISLALLESRVNESKRDNDRLGMFLPLVIDALQGVGGSSLSVDDVRRRVYDSSGLELPRPVISSLLGRLTKRRYLTRKNSRYTRTINELPYSDISGDLKRIENDYDQLVACMIAYAREHGLECPGEDYAREQLVRFFDKNFRSLSVKRVPQNIDDVDDAPSYPAWVAKFFAEQVANSPNLLEIAATQVRGRIAYDAAFLPGFTEGEQRLSGTIVYLDSPVICCALGFGSSEDEALMLEAIETLRRAGVVCRVLDQTVAEISRILTSVYANWGHPRVDEPPNSYMYCMAQRGFDRGQIYRLSMDPVVEIKKRLGLTVVPAPTRKNAYVADEARLEERLQRKDGKKDDSRIWHDIDCVAAVLTERGGVYATSLPKARIFFLTQSYLTIRNVNLWWRQDEHRQDIAPIFSLLELANYAWLYDGKNMEESYAKESVVAVCAASMLPSESAWRSFAQKVFDYIDANKLTSNEAMDYLYSLDSRVIVAETESECLNAGEPTDSQMDYVLSKVDERVAERVCGSKIERLEAKQSALVANHKKLQANNSELKNQIARRDDDLAKVGKQRDEAQARETKSAKALAEAQSYIRRRAHAKAQQRSLLATISLSVGLLLISIALILWQRAVGVPSDNPMFLLTLLSLFLPIIPWVVKLRSLISSRLEQRYLTEWSVDRERDGKKAAN